MRRIGEGRPLHIFICVNERAGAHCGHRNELRTLKRWVIENGLLSKVQITGTTCLGYCGENRVCWVYPDNMFYEFRSLKQVKEFITNQL